MWHVWWQSQIGKKEPILHIFAYGCWVLATTSQCPGNYKMYVYSDHITLTYLFKGQISTHIHLWYKLWDGQEGQQWELLGCLACWWKLTGWITELIPTALNFISSSSGNSLPLQTEEQVFNMKNWRKKIYQPRVSVDKVIVIVINYQVHADIEQH